MTLRDPWSVAKDVQLIEYSGYPGENWQQAANS
jgi:hypothetical protein